MSKSKEDRALLVSVKRTLIELVQMYESIWDQCNVEHKNANVLDNAWQQIKDDIVSYHSEDVLTALNLNSVKNLKAVWQNLRSQYLEAKRKSKGKSGDGLKDKPARWQFYESMSFTDTGILAIPTQNSFRFEKCAGDSATKPSGGSHNNLLDDFEDQVLHKTKSKVHKEQMKESSEKADASGNSLLSSASHSSSFLPSCEEEEPGLGDRSRFQTSTNPLSAWSPSKQRKRRLNERDSKPGDSKALRDEAFRSAILHLKGKEEDEDDLFCKYVAKQLKKLDKDTRVQVHSKIHHIVHDALIKTNATDPL